MGVRTILRFVEKSGGKTIPLVAAPYLGEVGRRLCAESGVSWLDLSGNAHLVAPNLRVIIEGKPNLFKSVGRPPSLFAPKSSRIARRLLMDPKGSFTQRALARAAGLDEGFTSKIVSRLEQQQLVTRSENGEVGLADFKILLEAWREAYDFSKHSVFRGHLAARSSDEVLRRLSEGLNRAGIEYAATGLAGAWLLDPFVGYRLVVLYVAQAPSDETQRAIGFREEKSGENIWLVTPNDPGVFHGSTDQKGVRCVHPIQAYLDLKDHPERSAEASERLLKKFLSEEHHV